MLWELVTGKHLFRGKSDAGTLRLVRACEVPAPSALREGVPPELDRVLLKALAKEPRKRFPDARAMQEAMQEVLVGLPPADVQRFVYMFDDGQTDEQSLSGLDADSNTEMESPASVQTMDVRASPETRSERSGLRQPGTPIFRPPQASPAELSSTAELLTRLTGPLTNLTPRVSSFVGRVAELADLHQLLRQGSRLVTLLGPGGTGKTRLAQQLAGQLVGHYSKGGDKGPKGGVWFCDLTEARDVDGVCHAVAKALGVPLGRGDAVTQLSHAIAARGEVLLVLDNFEQVVALAAETVEPWLQRATEARLIVTSRELLKVAGESVFEVPPLRTPQPGEAPRSSEAVQLFFERARAVRPTWEPTPAEEQAVAEIVQQLDGLPLAIELAAGRVGVLSPTQLVQRLPRRFELLSTPAPASERQTTLKGAIDWSWNMLVPEERVGLAQLSVFRGGFTAEAAEAVVDLTGTSGASDALSMLLTLRSKSLVRSYYAPGSSGENRYGLFESIREYAGEKLAASAPLAAGARERHARFYVALGGRLSAGAEGSASLLDALELERENLNAVFQRAVEGASTGSRALRATLALDPLLALRGPFRVHLMMLEAALEKLGGDDPVLRALGLEARARAFTARGRIPEAFADASEMLQLAARAGQSEVEGRAMSYLGTLERLRGNAKEARRWYDVALQRHRAVADRRMEGRTLSNLGTMLDDLGQTEQALQVWTQALEVHREVGDRRYEGTTLSNLGVQQQNQGLFSAARDNYLQALAIHRELGNHVSEGIAHINLGDLNRDLEHAPQALRHYQSALAILRESGARTFEGLALASLGSYYQEQGNLEEAVARYREASRVLREVGDKRYEGLTLAALAAALAGLQTMNEAEQLLEQATQELNETGDLNFLDALDVYRAHVELAKAMQKPAQGRALFESVQRRVKRAEQALDPDPTHPNGLPSPADRSEQVRAALRSLRAAMRRTGMGRR